MKCQHCGNELVPDEVFCGQCGNPNATPIQPTEMMQTPSSRSGLMGNGNRADAFPSSQAKPNQSVIRQNQGSQPQGGFYQDATEAQSIIPGTQYSPQGFQSSAGMSGGYNNNSGQFGTQAQQQPFLTGNYPPNTNYPATPMGFSNGQFGQGYGSRPGVGGTPPPQKRNNALMVVVIVCLLFAIITVGVVGTLFALKNGSSTQTTPTTVVQATTAATATPTPSPTPSPTATPTPSPTAVPTPAPDANFAWCGTQCTQSGYQIEYPNGWTQGATQSGAGIQFTHVGDVLLNSVAVKTPSAGATSASDLLAAEAVNFSSQTGYQSPQNLPSVTIGGENWNAQVLYYQINGQTEQVNIYATIHQGKGYVIELQAGQTQFPSATTQYFGPMIASFQFVAATA